MATITLWYLDGSTGSTIYSNIMAEYKLSNNGWPRNNKDIAQWLTHTGWPCEHDITTFTLPESKSEIQSGGLRFSDRESLTAFMMRWL